VVTPNVFNFDLWKTSGHADHYRENMFAFDVEKQEFGLKPMNCPGHCVMFANRARSYRWVGLGWGPGGADGGGRLVCVARGGLLG
jgi:threonyl-tRNA synthetase